MASTEDNVSDTLAFRGEGNLMAYQAYYDLSGNDLLSCWYQASFSEKDGNKQLLETNLFHYKDSPLFANQTFAINNELVEKEVIKRLNSKFKPAQPKVVLIQGPNCNKEQVVCKLINFWDDVSNQKSIRESENIIRQSNASIRKSNARIKISQGILATSELLTNEIYSANGVSEELAKEKKDNSYIEVKQEKSEIVKILMDSVKAVIVQSKDKRLKCPTTSKAAYKAWRDY